MNRLKTFEQKLAASFVAVVALAVVITLVAVVALQQVVQSKDAVISGEAADLTQVQALGTELQRGGSLLRGYLLTGDGDTFLEPLATSRQSYLDILDGLEAGADAEGRRLGEAIRTSEAAYQDVVEQAIERRQSGNSAEAAGDFFERDIVPKRTDVSNATSAFLDWATARLADARGAASDTATTATTILVVIAALAVLAAIVLGLRLNRQLRRSIGTTVDNVRTSSAELQATANQQAAGAREQATAMNEITTTISELLATSRQIDESAQRIAEIAEQAAAAGQGGVATIELARESILGIRRQMDLVVEHMLGLGDKSQQIGLVLDIVSELAEQTNILAINATIEAAGAGDAGQRFGVVAEEIRRLADRVTESTKEIRTLIDDVRGAVNTTVMATETGSKAVDAGATQFDVVATSFGHIAGMVSTAAEAAREIELSTKQQTTAVEQVNVAAADVAQATRETEAGSAQTLATATQLYGLSDELQQLVKAGADS
jgi:methyl-accepting chemotaxis protein